MSSRSAKSRLAAPHLKHAAPVFKDAAPVFKDAAPHFNAAAHLSVFSLALVCLFSLACAPGRAAAPYPGLPTVQATVPQCTAVHLGAAYLAETAPNQGPGFLLTVMNDTGEEIKLARPFPSSAHWYAEAPSGRWLWRASSGFGGALVNALNERGPLFAYRPAKTEAGTRAQLADPPAYITVGAHRQKQWAESLAANSALSYRPGCALCRNPQDGQVRAVLAYAYAAPPGELEPELLACGLRSNLVVMPPPPQ